MTKRQTLQSQLRGEFVTGSKLPRRPTVSWPRPPRTPPADHLHNAQQMSLAPVGRTPTFLLPAGSRRKAAPPPICEEIPLSPCQRRPLPDTQRPRFPRRISALITAAPTRAPHHWFPPAADAGPSAAEPRPLLRHTYPSPFSSLRPVGARGRPICFPSLNHSGPLRRLAPRELDI